MMLEPDRDRRRNRDRVVDLNAARFPQDGFDLDLTYVTGRIIVHGFPATGVGERPVRQGQKCQFKQFYVRVTSTEHLIHTSLVLQNIRAISL